MKIGGQESQKILLKPFLTSRPRLKRVEAKEARERGLAFRNPNTSDTREPNISSTREPNISNTREPNISNAKAWITSNIKEPNVSRH